MYFPENDIMSFFFDLMILYCIIFWDHLGWFYKLFTVNIDTIGMGVLALYFSFDPFQYTIRKGYNRIIWVVLFLRPIHTDLHSGLRVPFTPYFDHHLKFNVFLITAILTGVRWYLCVVLIGISLTARMLNIFLCIYCSFVHLLRTVCLINSFGHLLVKLFVLLVFSSLYIYISLYIYVYIFIYICIYLYIYTYVCMYFNSFSDK
jgi:hypothetical protein